MRKNMYTIYGIKNCSTMKRAFTVLDELGIEYAFHDYKKSGIDAQTLQRWIDTLGLDMIMNRKGTTWRRLSEAEQTEANTVAGAIKLMGTQTSVIKRPILSDGKQRLICGFTEHEYRQLA
jgi:Spx/MgsR family transcriptional regulator